MSSHKTQKNIQTQYEVNNHFNIIITVEFNK